MAEVKKEEVLREMEEYCQIAAAVDMGDCPPVDKCHPLYDCTRCRAEALYTRLKGMGVNLP